jgi:O-acetyl-ADP-ribose deacetylase (regulator of RNase III)
LIEAKARELVLRARDAGWSGPPYNPLAIADLLNIQVEANSEIADARTVANGPGIRIEFNPTCPRERVRFSIAHEIAHTLFPDVGEKTRHRGGRPTSADDWQLEMLCNLAAAEFVMPLGSLPPSEKLPTIEQLMSDRRRFDVSAEAYLIRVVKVTAEPAVMFCASPIGNEGLRSLHYRVDYCVSSKSASTVIAVGTRIPTNSIVYSCAAIGQTNHATETWIAGKSLLVECVGIPGFPGSAFARVAGIARFVQGAERDELKLLQGDVLTPVGSGSKVICQLVNDQARVWGGGVARASAKKFPDTQKQYSHWITQTPKRERLGRVHFAEAGDDLTIASLVAQEGYGLAPLPRIRYAPLAKALTAVAQYALERKASVHIPRIGTGQSGGMWDTVEEIIRDTLTAKGVHVTVYDLPPKRQAAGDELSFEFSR